MMQLLLAALLLLLVLSLHGPAQGIVSVPASSSDFLSLDVTGDASRCVGQELDQEDVATFYLSAYLLSSKDRSRLSGAGYKGLGVAARLTDPDDVVIMDERLALSQTNSLKEVRMTIKTRGVFDICFELDKGPEFKAEDEISVRVGFFVDYKAAAGGKASTHIAKDDVPSLEVELAAAQQAIDDISKELDFARRQEVELRQAGAAAEARMRWFAVLSTAILLSVSLWQIVFLRRFFVSKKLL